MKVLVAEDDTVFRRILEANLTKWEFEVTIASEGNEAWEVLNAADAPQLAILDWMMPGLDGIEICRRLRKRGFEPYTYIILLTSRDLPGDMVAGLDAGADDYITKPFNHLELKARLRAGKRILDLQADLVAARDELRYQATHDTLTRLLNRAAIINSLMTEMNRSHRQKTPLAAALADIDRFKSINDTHGHASGDLVLREVARRLTASVRPYDLVGRYGGEEFLLVFPGLDESSGASVMDRIRNIIGGECIQLDKTQISVTISMGVAVTSAARPVDIDALIQRADIALYRAKSQGRNRVVLADGEYLDAMPLQSGAA